MSTPGAPEAQLGYLLKHAGLRHAALHDAALAPLGIDGRELGILLAVADGVPRSQQDVAERLGIDRTTMVAFLDVLEDKHLVERRPDPGDRRRNVLELTAGGVRLVERALEAGARTEATFLERLTPAEARRFRATLTRLADAGS